MRNGRLKKRTLILCALLCLNGYVVTAQVGFRIMPTAVIPAGKDHFNTGFGVTVSLDWAFLNINRLDLGISAMGGLVNFPIDESSPFNLFEGALGPFVQWRLMDRLSLRADACAGVYQYAWDEESNTKFLAGGELSAMFHITPYFSAAAGAGYTRHWFSDRQPINSVMAASVGIHLNLSELLRPQARLRGSRTGQNRIFPVIFTRYEESSIATVRITNDEPNAVTNIQVSFLMERYMNQPSLFTTIGRLGPGESVEIPVNALFNESMLDLNENIVASAQVITAYRSLGSKKTSGFSLQMPVYHRNAMTWEDDRQAAAFVSPRDSAAVYFSRYVESSITAGTAAGNTAVPDNVRRAAALFEALRLYGISYIVDPNSSYVELSENAAAMDTLNYPYETLFYRGGDCDDLSILFAAMLEAQDIASAFITIPGHIYIAFDTGDAAYGNAGIIEHSGRRWLPVEVTVMDRSFSEACRIGARQWRSAGEEARLYPMNECWLLYPPVSPNAAGDKLPDMPERSAIRRALETEPGKLR